jgi:hypothetical protein
VGGGVGHRFLSPGADPQESSQYGDRVEEEGTEAALQARRIGEHAHLLQHGRSVVVDALSPVWRVQRSFLAHE